MDVVEKLLIPVLTIIVSIAGSAFVTFRALSRTHTEEWLLQLRESLSSFLAVGAYIPLDSTEQDLWEYKKRLFMVKMLLDPTEDKEHAELMMRLSTLQNYLMTNFNNRSMNPDKYSGMMSDVMLQYFKVASEAKKKSRKPLIKFRKKK